MLRTRYVQLWSYLDPSVIHFFLSLSVSISLSFLSPVALLSSLSSQMIKKVCTEGLFHTKLVHLIQLGTHPSITPVCPMQPQPTLYLLSARYLTFFFPESSSFLINLYFILSTLHSFLFLSLFLEFCRTPHPCVLNLEQRRSGEKASSSKSNMITSWKDTKKGEWMERERKRVRVRWRKTY
jgi:hypothetical protein